MIAVLRFNSRGDLVRDKWVNGVSAEHADRHGVRCLHVRDAENRLIGLVESAEVEGWQVMASEFEAAPATDSAA